MSGVTEIPVGLIDIEGNPRRSPADLDDLAASIRQRGVLQPIRVRAIGNRYRLVFGQRRLLASRLAGLATIPAILAGEGEDLDLVDAIVENLQRQDLNAIEEARAIQRLVDSGMDTKDAALLLGRSHSHVTNRLRVLHTDPYVVESVSAGLLPIMHAIHIAALPMRQQKAIAKRAVSEQWSEHRLRVALAPALPKQTRPPRTTPELEAAQGADRYVDGLMNLTPRVPDLTARLLLWAMVEMDVFVQGRFEKRHSMGYGDERIWNSIGGLSNATISRELATVLAEIIAEYGPTGVRAAVPRKGAA